MIKNRSNGLKKMSDRTDKVFEESIKKVDKNFNEMIKKGIKDMKLK